jgi:membrane associated rhomboid family serine protease
LWVRLAGTGTNRYRAFSLIGALLLIQLLFGVLFGGTWDWVADLAGFATGFLLSFVVSPGGFGRVLAMIRQR